MSASPLGFALELRGLELSVIPVPRPVAGTPKGRAGDGKVPAIAWKEYQAHLPTEDEIRTWFATDQNLAIITGAVSGVVVVDADSPEAVAWVKRNMLRTPWRVRTARGLHLYYRHPGVTVRNRARIVTHSGSLALDVRGDGGYVIGPSSVHASGHMYTAEGNWNVPSSKLPAFWVGLLERPKRAHPAKTRRRPTGSIVDRARLPKPHFFGVVPEKGCNGAGIACGEPECGHSAADGSRVRVSDLLDDPVAGQPRANVCQCRRRECRRFVVTAMAAVAAERRVLGLSPNCPRQFGSGSIAKEQMIGQRLERKLRRRPEQPETRRLFGLAKTDH